MGPTTVSEPRQRWRLTLARDLEPAEREASDAWAAAFDEAGLPVAWTEGARPRPRIAVAASLPTGMGSRAELLEVTLTERWPIWRVRDALADRVPPGWHLIDLEDVWVGAPPLPGRVAAADYRITLAGDVGVDVLAGACAGLLAAATLPRERAKGDRTIDYDLRPLLLDVTAPADDVIVVRTRIHPELGSGRPEEVVAAIGDAIGAPLTIGSIVRERLLLAGDREATTIDAAGRLTESAVEP